VLPILLIYRKYYGRSYTIRITALMLITMVVSALIVAAMFSALGLVPTGPRPARADIFSSIQINYKLALNLLGFAIFGVMFWLTARRGATDPVCGMKVDRGRAVTKEIGAETYYFCSEHCLRAFEAGSEHTQHRGREGRVAHAH
jgi:YHS domain-containing protein